MEISAKLFNHNFENGSFYLYDQNNNIIYYKNGNSNWSKREYDQNNNMTYYKNADGGCVKRKYNDKDNLIYFENSDGKIKKHKIDIINQCGDCSKRIYEGNDIYCSVANKIVKETSLPDWCPLENIK